MEINTGKQQIDINQYTPMGIHTAESSSIISPTTTTAVATDTMLNSSHMQEWDEFSFNSLNSLLNQQQQLITSQLN
jgi:hypothetical protein